ncbi:MAG: toxin-antitoxin system YwqK family antitoxin [Planctomycetota bacterium]
MQIKMLAILTVLIAGLGGCSRFANMTRVSDHSMYNTGELKMVGCTHSYNGYTERKMSAGYTSKYFKNGRLQSETFSINGKPKTKLGFYKNGRLKLEERFDRNQLVYGVYYAEDGSIIKSVGNRISGSTSHLVDAR